MAGVCSIAALLLTVSVLAAIAYDGSDPHFEDFKAAYGKFR